MGTHVEPFPARTPSARAWIAVVAVVLLLAALGAGTLIGRATVEEPAPPQAPEGLAAVAVVETIDAGIAATNAGDEAALAAMWAEDGVMTDMIAGTEIVGADEIAAAYASGSVSRLERVSEVVQIGDFSANAFTYDFGSGIAVFQIGDDGLIAHQWVMGV